MKVALCIGVVLMISVFLMGLINAEMKALSGLIIFFAGGALVFGGGIWLLVEGFKVSIAWGVGMLLCGFISLGFIFQRWDVAKLPFFTQLAGWALMYLAFSVFRTDLPKVPGQY